MSLRNFLHFATLVIHTKMAKSIPADIHYFKFKSRVRSQRHPGHVSQKFTSCLSKI